MNGTLAVFGALGGVAVFIGAVFTVVRAIFRQVGATEDNTVAMTKLNDKLEVLEGLVNQVEHRTTILETRWENRDRAGRTGP